MCVEGKRARDEGSTGVCVEGERARDEGSTGVCVEGKRARDEGSTGVCVEGERVPGIKTATSGVVAPPVGHPATCLLHVNASVVIDAPNRYVGKRKQQQRPFVLQRRQSPN